MKLFHLSDLHLGKRLCGISLIEDQRAVLNKIIGYIKSEKPGAVMIAGDVYDRSVPPEDAVALFDDFLYELSEVKVPVLIISGNHDSAERLAYGGRILNRSGIYISAELNKNNYESILKPVTLKDEFGEINFYLLPFVTPYMVKAARGGRPEAEISNYTDALRVMIDEMNIDKTKRNVLIAHQFVTGAKVCESETVSVGGLDNVNASVFEPFDYTALGHIHGPQHIGSDTVRYCGTPLKYSFSEEKHNKSITVVDIGEKGNVKISNITLDAPLHDLRVITSTFDEAVSNGKSDDYIKVVLTDKDPVTNALNKLREYFPNIMQLGFESTGTKADDTQNSEKDIQLTPLELFMSFYKLQTNSDMNERQIKIVEKIFDEIKEENV